MNFYCDEETGEIKYTMDLTHLFAKAIGRITFNAILCEEQY